MQTKAEIMLRDLLKASRDGDLGKVKRIAGTGLDIDQEDHLGFTALDQAADGGHLGIMRYLVEEKGANPKGHGIMPPLLAAVGTLRYEAAVYLLGKGATMDDTGTDKSLTALDFARRLRNAGQFIDLFISLMDDGRKMREFFKAADPVKAVPRSDREDWLQGLRQSYINIIAGFTRLQGFDLDMKKDGSTALHMLAAWDRGLDFVKVLTSAGANIFATDPKGRTAEKIANEAGNTAISDYLAGERVTRSVAAVKKGTGTAISAPEKAVFRRRVLAV